MHTIQKHRMSHFIITLALLCIATPLLAQSGGPYELTWSTIDGGGGSSSGGPYSLTGTIGQSDAGSHTGGDYILAGGFWHGSGCIVGLDDLAAFTAQWLASGPELEADFDDSGEVNLVDYSELASYWMQWCPNDWPL